MVQKTQVIPDSPDPSLRHPDYVTFLPNWVKIRDCIAGESVIKSKKEEYLPRPGGMSGEYAAAYEPYVERAHFPLICAYSLQGALGIIITKIPEFNVPKGLEYILKNATKDGLSIQQLFLDTIVEILQTGRCPLLVDIVSDKNQFRFVKYVAESLINWKTETIDSEANLILAVFEEEVPATEDIFSHENDIIHRVLTLDKAGNYSSRIFADDGEWTDFSRTPSYMGKPAKEVPLFIAGSISNTYEVQPIPLLAVANGSIQIYRKEADLANSEFLSCNPTLIFSGVSNDANLPNVVGSSVLISLPDSQARGYYTKTDTGALSHVKSHIDDLYEESIRHGVSLLDTRKGVESAEALRIRQATQSASIYSIFLSAITAIVDGLKLMAEWSGENPDDVVYDAPTTLTYDIPESQLVKALEEGVGTGVFPIEVVHRYLVRTGLLEQTINLEEYKTQLEESASYIAARKIKEKPAGAQDSVDEE